MPVLSDRVGLKHNVPQGTYFVMIDISDFLALPQFKGWTDLQFCEWMIREVGVAAVPGSSFFREPVNHLIGCTLPAAPMCWTKPSAGWKSCRHS